MDTAVVIVISSLVVNSMVFFLLLCSSSLLFLFLLELVGVFSSHVVTLFTINIVSKYRGIN